MSKANVSFLHPSKDGSGSAMKMEMNYQDDDSPGFIRFRFAKQDAESFDFDNHIKFDFGIHELTKIVSVITGDAEEFNEGNPLSEKNRFFFMKKMSDGFALAACEKNSGDTKKIQIVLKPHEAMGLKLTIEQSMFFLAFIKGVNP